MFIGFDKNQHEQANKIATIGGKNKITVILSISRHFQSNRKRYAIEEQKKLLKMRIK